MAASAESTVRVGQVVFQLEDSDQAVLVVGSARVHWQRRGFVDADDFVVFVDLEDRQVEDRQLSSFGVVFDAVAVSGSAWAT